MPQPHSVYLGKPPVGQRRCPACGLPMLLFRIESSDQLGYDERIFECATCAYAETVSVKSDSP